MNTNDSLPQLADSVDETRQVTEKQWAKPFTVRLNSDLAKHRLEDTRLVVVAGKKLPYLCQIQGYGGDSSPVTSSYETDLLIIEESTDGRWIPRVVVECKLGRVTTHDALTYSAKAATHKNVHPYLRYGILIGDHKNQALPGRLIRHGAYFDFMVSWSEAEPGAKEWAGFCELLGQELKASRTLQELLTKSRSAARKKISTLHRPLIVS